MMETTRAAARHDSKARAKHGNAKASDKNDSVNEDYSHDASSFCTSSASDCPLFMEGLPSDFQQNIALAAIASLIGDNVSDEEFKDKKKGSHLITSDVKSGGGKAKKMCKRIIHSPYSKENGAENNGKKESTTLGEAQLFLNMWKI
ncbi:hypothetical protein ACHAXA_002509 [Cyclostephanos tholiformis]|uniref:Uncharacterized protein n=1 Tax=Cyclostephanos tholiformis TaxID=382380 RepID=A0ABD3SDK4_9STRA